MNAFLKTNIIFKVKKKEKLEKIAVMSPHIKPNMRYLCKWCAKKNIFPLILLLHRNTALLFFVLPDEIHVFTCPQVVAMENNVMTAIVTPI